MGLFTRATPAELRFRTACDEQVASQLRSLTLGVGLLLVPFTLAGFFLLPAPARWLVGPYDAAISVMMLFVHLRIQKDPLRADLAHPFVACAGFAMLGSVLFAARLTDDLLVTTTILLLIVGAGVLILSWVWFGVLSAMAVGGWLLVTAGLAHDRDWGIVACLVGGAIVLSGLAHAARLGAFRKLLRTGWAAQDAEARLRRVLDTAPVTIAALDEEGRFTLVAGAPTLGARAWRVSAAVGRPYHEAWAVHPERVASAQRALAGESFVQSEVVGEREYEVRWGPLADDAAAPGALAVAVDVTERKRAEAERRRAEEQAESIVRLQEMDRFKTRILNTASHELNTPLTPIKIQLHMLKRESDSLAQKQQAAIQILDRNFSRLSTLVSDIMDVARIQEDRLRIERKDIDIVDAAREAVLSFEPAGEVKGVRVVADLEGTVPAHADPRRILQILFNLVSNALKFTPAGGTIRVRARRDGDHAVVDVIDSGAGMDAAQLARLFQPFSQVHDTMQTTEPGTGLGLYISRGIAEAHDGTLTASSAGRGSGSTFTFRMPLRTEP